MDFKPQQITREAVAWELRKAKKRSSAYTYAGNIEKSVTPKQLSELSQPNLSDILIYPDYERLGVAQLTSEGIMETVPPIVPYLLKFETWQYQSLDIGIFRNNLNNKFNVSKNGTYLINVFWEVSITQEDTFQTETVNLYIYKNGSNYRKIDMIQAFLNTEYMNYFSVQGSKLIQLTNNDKFNIALVYTISGGGTQWVSPNVIQSGYIDINYVRG